MPATVALYNRSKIHPLKLALWVGLTSISMMFAGLMSAYVVRQAAGNWLEFPLPVWFDVSTLVIIFSSLIMHASLYFFKKGKEFQYKLALVTTFVLGLAFVLFQYYGWMTLQEMGIDLKGNPSGSFLYVISGVHVAHVLGGLAILFVAMIHAFVLSFKVNAQRINRLSISTQYWHYVDIVWIVLYLFFNFYR